MWNLISEKKPTAEDGMIIVKSRDGDYFIGRVMDVFNGMLRIVSSCELQDDGSLKQLTTGFGLVYFTHWAKIESTDEDIETQPKGIVTSIFSTAG